MRILFVSRSTSDHPGSGGMERAFETLVERLSSRNQTALLTTSGAGRSLESYEHTWRLASHRPGRYTLRWWHAVTRPGPWIGWEPDIVVSVSSAIGPCPQRGFPHQRYVCQMHGTAWAEISSAIRSGRLKDYLKIPLHLSRIPREWLTLRSASRVVSIGSAVTSQLSAFPYFVPPCRLVEIPNGIDTTHFRFSFDARRQVRSELQVADETHLAAVVGRLHPQKGADTALKAMAQCAESVHMVICGDGPELLELQRLASELGVSDRTTFLGLVSRDDLPRIMSAADSLVFPTRRKEGLPLNVLEALACGLDVLTSAGSGLPPDLERQVVITQASPDQVAHALGQVARKGHRSTRRSRLPSRYEAKQAASDFESLLRAVLGKQN